MAEKQWQFVTNVQPPKGVHDTQTPEIEERLAGIMKRIFYLDSDIVPGAMYGELVWITKEMQADIGHPSHSHDYDEIICFLGMNASGNEDLGATVEGYIEGEKHIITKTCVLWMPAGVKHAPFLFKDVKTPFIHGAFGNGKLYRSIPQT